MPGIQGGPPAKLAKEFVRLSANFLGCGQPSPWEIKDFISDRLKFYQLNFAADAVPLFAQSVGENLFKIENELNRLCLSFIDHKGSISSGELRPLLSFLREDHAFKIDTILTQEAFHQALILFKDLMDRGESGIAVLGILALHCRRALQIHARRNLPPKLIAEQLQISLTAVQNYLPYIAKRSPLIFHKALQLCFEADRKMKSTRQDEELLLDRIVWELRGELPMNGQAL